MTRLTWLAAPLLAVLLAGTACQTEDDFSASVLFAMFIKDNGGVCTTDAPAKSNVTIIAQGVLDTSNSSGYVFAPLLVNGALPLDEAPNSHIMYVQGVDTELQAVNDADSQRLVANLAAMNMVQRTQFFGVGIPPGGLDAPIFNLIDLAQVNAIAAALSGISSSTGFVEVIVHMRPFGVMDDATVVGPPFDFPITICAGCLLADLGLCSKLPTGVMYPAGGACGEPQDAVLSCCEAPNGVPVCPAVGTYMPPMMTMRSTAP